MAKTVPIFTIREPGRQNKCMLILFRSRRLLTREYVEFLLYPRCPGTMAACQGKLYIHRSSRAKHPEKHSRRTHLPQRRLLLTTSMDTEASRCSGDVNGGPDCRSLPITTTRPMHPWATLVFRGSTFPARIHCACRAGGNKCPNYDYRRLEPCSLAYLKLGFRRSEFLE